MRKKNQISGACGRYGERRCAYKSLVGKPDITRPLGNPRRRWENIIKIELKGMG
jgi:hypothetical protein